MNIKEYISSGILESFAAGQLSKEESSEVELEIRNDPEIRSDYEKILQTLQIAVHGNLKSPSPEVKDSLMNMIRTLDSIPISNPISNKESNFSNYMNYSSSGYLLAASIVFLIVSLAGNYFLWDKLKDANFQIAVLSDQRKVMVQEYEAVSRKLAIAAADMEIIKDRSYKMIDMKGLEKSPNSNVIAFWNPESKKVYVSVMNLPVPPSDKQYQLWALSNGKPVDAGVMDVDPSDKSLHEMKNMEDAQAFAITLEPKGGSVNPTMDQMYVMGEV